MSTQESDAATDAARDVRRRPLHARTTVFGLLLVAAAAAFLGVAEWVGGSSEAIGFAAPIVAVATVVAALAWRFGTWSKVVAAIVGLLLFVNTAEIFVPMAAAPGLFVRFVAAVTLLSGALLALGGGIAAVVKRRDVRTEASFVERQIRTVVLAGIGLLVLFSGIVSLTGEPAIDAEARAAATEVVVHNYEFDDGIVHVPAGEPVTIIVDNRDWTRHTFTIQELGIDVELRPGSEVLIELPALDAGTYRINCRPHSGHEARLAVG